MKKNVEKMILKGVEEGYDLIFKKFSDTRKHIWKGLEFIADFPKKGDNVLDFGCGNGRLAKLLFNKDIKYWGLDVCQEFINFDKANFSHNNFEYIKIDSSQSSLSFPDDFFNVTYSIAVFHHFPGKDYREKMAEELFRVTKPGGYLIVTVWNLWKLKYVKCIIRNWKEKFALRSLLDWNDCYITFKDNVGNIFRRYHHAFRKGEIVRLFKEAGFKTEKIMINKNYIYIGRKLIK